MQSINSSSDMIDTDNAFISHNVSLVDLSVNQKSWLLLLTIFMFILILDTVTRLNVTSEEYSNNHQLQTLNLDEKTRLGKETQQAINMLYANFDVPEIVTSNDTVKDEPTMSLEDQQAQNGLLDKLLIDNEQYELLGTFWDKQYFAVLIKTDVKTNTTEEVKVIQGQAFGLYKVERITKQDVTFVSGERVIILSLFK